jgi:hypothetical protein
MTIFPPHPWTGTITFGLSSHTVSRELLYLATSSNEHNDVNVTATTNGNTSVCKALLPFRFEVTKPLCSSVWGGTHNVGSTVKRSKYKKCIGCVPRTIKLATVLKNDVLFVTNECLLNIHCVYVIQCLELYKQRGIKT